MTQAENNPSQAARAGQDTELERLRLRVASLEAERDRFRAELAGCAELFTNAGMALHSAARRESQLASLLVQWEAREAFFATTERLSPCTVGQASAAATLLCANDLRALLACTNPDCPKCKAQSKGEAVQGATGSEAQTGETGNAASRP